MWMPSQGLCPLRVFKILAHLDAYIYRVQSTMLCIPVHPIFFFTSSDSSLNQFQTTADVKSLNLRCKASQPPTVSFSPADL